MLRVACFYILIKNQDDFVFSFLFVRYNKTSIGSIFAQYGKILSLDFNIRLDLRSRPILKSRLNILPYWPQKNPIRYNKQKNAWVLGNTRFISRVQHDISLVRCAHSWDIMFSTRNKSGISAHPCIMHQSILALPTPPPGQPPGIDNSLGSGRKSVAMPPPPGKKR